MHSRQTVLVSISAVIHSPSTDRAMHGVLNSIFYITAGEPHGSNVCYGKKPRGERTLTEVS